MYTSINSNLRQESLRLFKDYQKTEAPSLRNKIMELNIGLVKKEAYHWASQCNESYEDLLQVGCIGLLRAIERFDVEKGHAFSSFAIPYIRGEIQHYLRDKTVAVRIPRRWLELGKQGSELTKKLKEQNRRVPTDIEISQALAISVKEWQDISLAYQNRELLSLDLPVSNSDDDKTSLGDLVPDSQVRSFVLSQEDKIRLQNALSQLEERTRKIVEFVFLHDLTQKETAERLEISVVTVSRRVKKGIEKLKNLMEQEI